MESTQKSGRRQFPISEPIRFFQGPPLKRQLSDASHQDEKQREKGKANAETERKTMVNFPELFRLQNQANLYTKRCALRSMTPISYPSNIPYQLQHEILVIAQDILEKCCYDFARQWFPFELERAGLDCAEALELTKWTRIILKYSEKLPSSAFAFGGPVHEILMSVQLLRHTAVHRLRTTSKGVSELIQCAITFTEALRDSNRTRQLETLHRQMKSRIEDRENEKYALDGGVTAILQNQLDGIVPQENDCSFEEEILALFEMLPIYVAPEQEECSSSDDDVYI